MKEKGSGRFPSLVVYVVGCYLTSSKVNTIVYQLYKFYMVQIWFLKFVKSILNLIQMNIFIQFNHIYGLILIFFQI